MKSFVLTGLLSACTLAAQPGPAGGSIEGHVFNSVTNAPLRKATVTLMSPHFVLAAETNADGWFQFTSLPSGTFKLSAKRPGFLDHAARRPIVLGPNASVMDAEIRLPPQGVISGRVLDEDDDPVAYAYIRIFKQVYRDGAKQWVNSWTNRTDDTGEYRVPNLKPGRYLVMANVVRQPVNNKYLAGGRQEAPAMNYIPVYYPNAVSEQAASPVEVGAGAEVRGIDIHLFKAAKPAAFHVSGKVIGLRAVSQTPVSVWLEQPDQSNYAWQTEARAPDYAFTAEAHPGPYRIFASVRSDPIAFATGSLTVTEDVTGLVLAMAPAPDLTGRLSVAEAAREVNLSGMRVILLRRPATETVPQAGPDTAGKLSFGKVAPGHYSIDIEDIPSGCFVQEVRLGGQPVSAGDVEILTSSQLEIVLSNTAGAITGSVSDDDGRPFPDATVTLIPADAKLRPFLREADDNGNFKFTNLPPGQYQLFAWEDVDNDQWQDPEFRKSYESRAAEITVGASETRNAQLGAIPAEGPK